MSYPLGHGGAGTHLVDFEAPGLRPALPAPIPLALPLRHEEPVEPPAEDPRSLRLLVVVDDPAAGLAIREALASDPSGADVEWVHALSEGLAPLRREPFDVLLLDLSLVGNGSLQLLDEPALVEGDTWLVLLDEPPEAQVYPRRMLDRVALETLPRDGHLAESLARLLRLARRTLPARNRASRYQSLFRHSADGILLFDRQGTVLDANPRAVEQLGYPREELVGLRVESLHPEQEGPRMHSVIHDLRRGELLTLELPVRRSDGTDFPAEVAASSFRAAGQDLVQVVVRDQSRRRALEQRLLEGQKMEALGRLAGGVAHDLNNLLTVIQGYGSLLRDTLGDDPQPLAFLAEVTAAGQRATDLTRQLLAFSRRQVLQPRLLDINEEISLLQRLLRRTLGEDVRLLVDLAPELPRVRLDPGQLEQIVVNLAINARDAMPQGGELHLQTSLASAPALEGRGDGSPEIAEPWIRLSVRDSGIGMPADVLRHLFEPFFTTKDRGKGTGLGLASVYGIVRQSGGDIRVASTPGAGTTFEILLPAGRPDGQSQSDTGSHPTLLRAVRQGGETVLVVEDDPAVRKLMHTVLRGAGYRVVEAADGDVALALAGSLTVPLDLLVTDMVLPDLPGVEVARRVLALAPHARVLFVSGHGQEARARQGRLLPGSRFLAKPFSPEALLDKVARTLARGAAAR